MPFDEHNGDHGGGGDDPAHDEEAIRMVAENVIMGLSLLSKANGLCIRCVGMSVMVTIANKMAMADPSNQTMRVNILQHVASAVGVEMKPEGN